MHPLTFFNRSNVEYIDELYEKYQKDPLSVEEPWRSFFMGFDAAQRPETDRPLRRGKQPAAANDAVPTTGGAAGLVHAYRDLGHWIADIDPLGQPRAPQPLLALSEMGFSGKDLTQTVGDGGFLGQTDGTLGGLVTALRRTYCGTFAAEFMHIPDKTQRRWLTDRIERDTIPAALAPEAAQRTLRFLEAADSFEQFLHTRFLGQKRFSIEGGESLLPMLAALIDDGAGLGASEFVFGMAHRGRLNVLAHILGKPYEAIFAEFLGIPMVDTPPSEGDVKYHLGFRTTYRTPAGQDVALQLSPNPSHLELVDPVVEGIAFARQELKLRAGGTHVERAIVPVLIHGEAAFAGQGIVFETLSLSQLGSYGTGGTLHVIVNNQVGFTATPAQTRSSAYPTESAKLVHAPIFHVNGNDPEAVVRAARIAIAFRQEFGRDVFLDLWCYRRYGHNEGDDPTFTQPLMYKRVDAQKPVSTAYAELLTRSNRITEGTVAELREARHAKLEEAYAVARKHATESTKKLDARLEKPAKLKNSANRSDTGVGRETLIRVARRPLAPPENFSVHPKLQKLMALRLEMAEGKKPLDWGCAEMLALGSLLIEGIPVRLTGQDSERGTFSHRHAVLHDVENGALFTPLADLAPSPDTFTVINTMLSELAILGFEYGYSVASPETFVLWEAQFGDFANGAQPIIDQFIAPGEAKWQLASGLVLLLPHGYEGQGPEHSSARLERFLQLCAEDNMQVCQPTTPASYFHMLRRQARLEPKKPLVVMTPKSLLRHPQAISSIDELERGTFSPVLDDNLGGPTAGAAKRILFCSGKIYYTLAAAREKAKIDDIAIYRLEQLAPFPAAAVTEKLTAHPTAKEIFWVQDEPRNMGPWAFVAPRLAEVAGGRPIGYCGRPEAASPATGNAKNHERQEAALLEQALGKKN